MEFEKRFAEAILEAQKIKEESYDQKAAEAVTGESLLTDFTQFYEKSDYEAADDAARNAGFDLRMTQPIYLLIKCAWNDIQDWAEEITK